MKWTKYTITTHIDAVDILSYELDAIGIEGIEIVDHQGLSDADKAKMFVDIAPDPDVVDDIAMVSFYMDADEGSDTASDDIINKVNNILKDISSYTDIGEGTISVSETEDKDWINNWKQYAKPFRASDSIAICPTWIDEVPEELNTLPHIIRIDPGVAFGTGSHETTKLCIQALDRYLSKGDRVLDVGCGSGILSIAAILLGAGYVTAVDIDEMAVKAATENFETNRISDDKYTLKPANLLDGDRVEGEYDIVVANILPDVIVPLTGIVPSLLKNGGLYITSGILASRESEVREALEQNMFTDIVTTPMGEWVGITARR